MANVLTGAYRIFIRDVAFTGAQIDNAIQTGKIPSTNWKQIFTNGDVTVKFSREILDLQTSQEGVVKSIISTHDTIEIEVPFADISKETIIKYCMINPVDVTDANFKPLKGSYRGADLSSNAKPLLIYHISYDPDNDGDTPKLGTGSDPQALLFFSVVNTSGIELTYSPDAQQVLKVTFKALSVKGTTKTGAGVFGLLTAED